jgi:hypothetical protein
MVLRVKRHGKFVIITDIHSLANRPIALQICISILRRRWKEISMVKQRKKLFTTQARKTFIDSTALVHYSS